MKADCFKLVCWFRAWRRLRSCCVSDCRTVPGRSSIHGWDSPRAAKDGPMRRLVRKSFMPMLASLALERSSSTTSVFRQRPV
jgi:hypothetical protein